MTRTLCLKVDVCTREGMRTGVPRLLDRLRRLDARATFCLAFGPDTSGQAMRNVLRPGFLRKMLRSGAPRLYGVRTMLAGTILPARPAAADFPDLVRRIADEGHEVAIHGWDHRHWQDRVDGMDESELRAQFECAALSFAGALGRPPGGTAAPAWRVTASSLAVADEFRFDWASDLRGGPVCRVRADGRVLRTPQVPTTGPCVEELLTAGVRGTSALATAISDAAALCELAVLAVHAEVEGGPYGAVLDELVSHARDAGRTFRTIGEYVAGLDVERLPVRDLVLASLPGRSGQVASAG